MSPRLYHALGKHSTGKNSKWLSQPHAFCLTNDPFGGALISSCFSRHIDDVMHGWELYLQHSFFFFLSNDLQKVTFSTCLQKYFINEALWSQILIYLKWKSPTMSIIFPSVLERVYFLVCWFLCYFVLGYSRCSNTITKK